MDAHDPRFRYLGLIPGVWGAVALGGLGGRFARTRRGEGVLRPVALGVRGRVRSVSGRIQRDLMGDGHSLNIRAYAVCKPRRVPEGRQA